MTSAPDHQEFRQRLRAAHAEEVRVGGLLLEAGRPVLVAPLVEAETPWEGWRFVKQHDVVVGGYVVEGYVVEVKSSRQRFTCADDFPFDDINVCTVRRWDSMTVRPVAFVLVSQVTGAMIALSSKTFPEWKVATSRDSTRDGWLTPTYRAHRSLWRPVEDLVEAFRVAA